MARYFDETFKPETPDYFKDAGKPKKADWKKHEADIAKRTGERRVAGSGNQPGKPGDVVGTKFHRDGKATKGKSISLSSKELAKVILQAQRMGRIPVIEIRLEAAEFPVPTDWVLLTAVDFQEITER